MHRPSFRLARLLRRCDFCVPFSGNYTLLSLPRRAVRGSAHSLTILLSCIHWFYYGGAYDLLWWNAPLAFCRLTARVSLRVTNGIATALPTIGRILLAICTFGLTGLIVPISRAPVSPQLLASPQSPKTIAKRLTLWKAGSSVFHSPRATRSILIGERGRALLSKPKGGKRVMGLYAPHG